MLIKNKINQTPSLVILVLSAVSCKLLVATSDAGFKSPCGKIRDVSLRIGDCTRPILDLIEGKVPKPRSDNDLVAICEQFASNEKCIRSTSRECLTGIHKTTASSVASSSRRFRLQECKNEASRAKYINAILCSIKIKESTNEIAAIFQNHTGIMEALRDSPNLKAEEKLIRGCCIFPELDRELIRVYSRVCPESTENFLKIMHALTEDARSTVCVRPKCETALNDFLNAPPASPKTILTQPVMDILFNLTN